MEPENSFFLVVHSQKSQEYFPNNTSSNFTNKLQTNMNLQNYEVALVTLYYHDDFVNNYDGQLLPIERSGVPFFDLQKNENVIWVNQLKRSSYNIQKTYPYLHTFINGMNAHLNRFGIKAKFTVEFGEGGVPISVIFKYELDYGYKLYFDDNLNDYLGFSKNDFEEGEYKSDKPLDIEGFEKLPNDTVFRLEKRRWAISKVELEQLFDPTLDDIAVAISSGCAKVGFTVQAAVDEDENTLTINTFGDTIFIRLSSYLRNYLKLPYGTEFKGRTTVTVPRNVINPYEPFGKTYLKANETFQVSSPSKVFVLCTLCTTHYYETKPLPILQILNRTEGRQEITFQSNPLIYTQVNSFDASTINIRLVDDNLNLLPERDEASVCILHFKKKWL